MLARRPRTGVSVFGALLKRGKTRPGTHPFSVNLTTMGALYIAAALFQASWLYLVFSNWGEARAWLSLGGIGWALAFLWLGMFWCILHLLGIGIVMVRLSRNREAVIIQTAREKQRMRIIATILALGIALDILIFPWMLGAEDKSLVVFWAGAMGGRILKGNLEAIFQYHRM